MMADYEKLFSAYKEPSLSGRYIALEHIAPLLDKLEGVQTIGRSVLGNPIYCSTFGTGKTKILLWSQMHGNESTTTKALFDLFNLLKSETDEAETLLASFTFYAIPILNPDGATLYTRENANGIDLNRDFYDLTQPESQLLLQVFDEYKPHYCFNLHDQRTIYGVGQTGKPATVSFLAPSYNQERQINDTRAKAISIIAAINDTLQRIIPGQIGRFDDSFNINCVGDTFQFRNVPTILFEAGHHPGDYSREVTRKLIFVALLSAIQNINDNVIVNNRTEDYLQIPQNNISFYDFVYKNVKINYDGNEIITNFAAQFTEALVDNEINFFANIAEVGTTSALHGHTEYDALGARYKDSVGETPVVDQKADFYLGDIQFYNGKEV